MKRTLRLALPLSLALLLAGCGEDPADLVARADRSLAVHDYNAARIDLTAALREQPRDDAVLLRLARVQVLLGDGEGALATLGRIGTGDEAQRARLAAEAEVLRGQSDAALDLLGNDQTPDAWRLRAMARLARSEPDAAIAAFERGLAAGEDARLIAAYAGYAIETGDAARAAGLIERLQRLAPRDFRTLSLKASHTQLRGDMAGARGAWQAVADAFPHRPEPLFALAELLEGEGKPGQALAMLDKAAAIAPRDPRVLALRVQVLSVKGDWVKVRNLLQDREGQLDPRSAEGMAYAEALLRLDRPEQARAMVQPPVLLSPENRCPPALPAQAQLAAGPAAGPRGTPAPMMDSALASPQEIAMAAEAARRLGDPQAGELTRREKSSETLRAQHLAGEAQAATARRDWAKAAEAWSALLAGRDDAEVLKRLAFARSQLGQHAEAQAAADRALALRPSSADAIHMAGLVRLRGGTDLPAALRLLGEAAAMDPGNPVYRADLAKAKAAAG
ncbi:MAG TPA: hypothetical protein PKE25_07715 [Novosphingobium sp.]|nr:hypothetical protein [Novosphingobium sp.]